MAILVEHGVQFKQLTEVCTACDTRFCNNVYILVVFPYIAGF